MNMLRAASDYDGRTFPFAINARLVGEERFVVCGFD
jgi:hypothetical protein